MGAYSMTRCWTRRRCLVALPALAALAQPAWATPQATPQAQVLPVRWPARLHTVEGQTIDTAAWLDQPAVVVFWATWCAFCRRHNVHVDKLHRSLGGRRLTVLGVALDRDADSVARHVQAQGIGFPVVLEAGQLRAQFTDRRSVPMTCLLDRQGRVTQRIPGEMAEADVMALAALALPALS